MGSFFGAIGRLIGAILVLFVLGTVLSFLGCDTSDGPGYAPPDYYVAPDPPVPTEPLPPLPTYDLPLPPQPPDLNQ